MTKERISITGEGNLIEVERGKVYRIRHRLPPIEPGGKRRWSPMRTVRGNIAKAREELVNYRKELEKQLNSESDAVTVGAYARDFHEKRKIKKAVSDSTLERDEIEIKIIEENFGNVDIEDLGLADIEKTYEKLRREGRSPSEIHKTHQKLNQIMRQAVKQGKIAHNPCDLVGDAKRPDPKERRSLSKEQARQLAIDLKEGERNGCVVVVWLALACGARRGEALGLLWEDVDLERKRIFFNKQYDVKNKRRNLKSKKSRRNLAIDDGTVRYLSEWKKIQSERFCGGRDVPGNMPVCTNSTGEHLSVAFFDKWRRSYFVEHGLGTFEKEEVYYDKKGIKRYRRIGYSGYNLHELRHTNITHLIGSGVDLKTVQNRAGHASLSTTTDIYAHVIEENDRAAADNIGDVFDL